jgi:carbon storage regulator
MLVLSRKINESIVLPELGITIQVVGVGSGRVRLGIEAPREVAIHRHEVFARVEQERPRSRAAEHAISG